MGYNDRCGIDLLVGLTLTGIEGAEKDSDEIIFTLENGDKFRMHHEPDCCEAVWLEDVCGEIGDLIGSEITMAEEVSSSFSKYDDEEDDDDDKDENYEEYKETVDCADESYTWTFYKLSTQKGSVTLRWFGTSNGYYSESVDFEKIPTSH